MHILFCHELGAGMGHISRDHSLILHLERQGHQISLASSQLKSTVKFFPNLHKRIYQAPIIHQDNHNKAPINFDDMLLRYGYQDIEALHSAIIAWQSLFTLIKPDKIIYNHSPTALLAASLSHLPAIVLGNGFEIPHITSWGVAFTPWEKISNSELHKKRHLLNHKIDALCKLAQSRSTTIEELYPETTTLLTIPEIDHFGTRENARYSGMPCMEIHGPHSEWRGSGELKVFVYLKSDHPKIIDLCDVLNRLGLDVIFLCINLPNQLMSTYKNITFITTEININHVIKNADFTITSGSNTMATSLMHGVPVIALPQVIEQFLAGVALEKKNLGTVITDYTSQNFKETIFTALKKQEEFKKTSNPLKSKYCQSSNDTITNTLLDEILH